MRKKHSRQTRLRAVMVLMAVFTVTDIAMWQGVGSAGASSVAALPASVAPVRAQAAVIAQPAPAPKRVGEPVRIKIPVIAVNALVLNVGLAADGSMGVPKKPRDTAWYSLGVRPGERGSAVIAGHVDWYWGAKGVFAKLKLLKKGDVITILDTAGEPLWFVVRETRVLEADDDASDVFLSTDGASHLNLVTCMGIWNKRTQQYPKRLVVFADRKID